MSFFYYIVTSDYYKILLNTNLEVISMVTETVFLETTEKLDGNRFVDIVDFLEKEFHSKQQGFICTELLKTDSPCEWVIIQHWKTKEDANNASKNMFTNLKTEQFRNCLNPKSVRINVYEQIKTWEI